MYSKTLPYIVMELDVPVNTITLEIVILAVYLIELVN